MVKPKIPSIKSLCQIKDVTPEQAELVRQALTLEAMGGLSHFAETHAPKSWRRFQSSRHLASYRTEILNELLGMFGAHSLFMTDDGCKDHPESDRDECLGTWLEAGDAYATTLIQYKGEWRVGCYTDLYEECAIRKVSLKRVYLNSGGYEPGRYGQYFGHDEPLFKANSDDGSICGEYLRAASREDAKDKLLEKYNYLKFYR
jgi:hypothetical protein